MATYQVGTPYIPGKTHWEERAEYNWRAGAHELRIFFRSPTAAEIADIDRGHIELGLSVADGGEQIFFCYRTDTITYSDAPYTFHAVREKLPDEAVLPPVLGERQMPWLYLILVDASTGLIAALRQITLPHDFAVALHNAIRTQAALPFDQAAYDQHRLEIYARYRSRDLMRRAVIRTTIPAPRRG